MGTARLSAGELLHHSESQQHDTETQESRFNMLTGDAERSNERESVRCALCGRSVPEFSKTNSDTARAWLSCERQIETHGGVQCSLRCGQAAAASGRIVAHSLQEDVSRYN